MFSFKSGTRFFRQKIFLFRQESAKFQKFGDFPVYTYVCTQDSRSTFFRHPGPELQVPMGNTAACREKLLTKSRLQAHERWKAFSLCAHATVARLVDRPVEPCRPPERPSSSSSRPVTGSLSQVARRRPICTSISCLAVLKK